MLREPNCRKRQCVHFQGVKYLGQHEESEQVFCLAFPKGIPEDIAYGDNPHLNAVPGDHGIQYKQKSGEKK